jgi:protein-S-isoprenylcysteine O-methyltransferase Ste14
MLSGIHLTNLWIFYVLAYAIALPVQEWANHKRGEPFDDPEFLLKGWTIFALAMVWLFGGLIISLFVPVTFGMLFYVGLIFYIGGMIVVILTFRSFAQGSGLVTSRIHRYSRNPGYVGWALVIFGMALFGWSTSLWSIIFMIYFLVTLLYFHWTVMLEEAFLIEKYGDSYRAYLSSAARYFGMPKGQGDSA